MRARALAPGRTVASIKRFMGRPFADLSVEERSETPYRLVPGTRGEILVALDDKTLVSPEEISALILARLKETAEAALETTVSRAVVTVPAYFNHSQREATRRAAELAGLTVERILNEPTAAALAYGLDRLGESATVAVYDLGGGTFDLSVLQLREGFFEVIATAGDTRLGGDDLDLALARHLAGELDLGVLSESEEATLRMRAREAKEALSGEERGVVRLPFFRGGASYEIEVTRERFEKLALPLIDRTGPICRRAFAEAAEKGATTVEKLILVGGSTRIPLVRTKLKEWFGLEPDLSQHPDEAVALGAAIQAGMLCGRVRQILLVDVTPLSLGIETFGGLMNVIIPRNSTIPVKAGELFTTAVDNQRSMKIHVLQGERERSRDNWSLGEFDLEFEAAPKGVPRVGVQFEIDANGILHVLARDVKTGHQKIVQMRSAVDVDDADVQKMVEEAVENAFDDLRARQWIEAKIRAGETLNATRKTMAEYDKDLDDDYRKQLHEALEGVEAVLSQENPKTKTGDPTHLKTANSRLDEVSRPLAEHAMDQVMEAMLRQRGVNAVES
jgi:molecular chaperone DnaK